MSERFYKLMGIAVLAYLLSFVPAPKVEEAHRTGVPACSLPVLKLVCR